MGAKRGTQSTLAPEFCAPLLLLCWLCCWNDDTNSDSGSHRRASEFFSRRFGSSAVSLHLPGTSGSTKRPLSAHRSHEEIPNRRKSHHEIPNVEARYHSAPSVIDEVIHRRDWDRSARDLHIPLNPDSEVCLSDISLTPERVPKAEPELSSNEVINDQKPCKKHYTNIKSSKKIKESKDDDKDTDATEIEVSNFYIGETKEDDALLSKTPVGDDIEYGKLVAEERNKSVYKAKEAKQSLNESIRSKDKQKPSLVPLEEGQTSNVFTYWLDEDIDQIDRSGAVHHTVESRMSIGRPYPPPSVEVVGYEGGACYLAEVGVLSELHSRPVSSGTLRARHASDGDILAPPVRPESGAFSESDLDLELEECEERPPEYHEVQHCSVPDHKETAI
ncbi:uncharacterized protein LOC128680932 isoform X2 [Plodia interpunctella]|uniref:uncharacterized protein LOC128680932 isoform X2 n=1 Tax=Plodia interpunctella TaxID=58824 RepID=UPI002367B813|nr:uncharacterized protein LOC128680932 isoform X2 [Plodia interpunctella]